MKPWAFKPKRLEHLIKMDMALYKSYVLLLLLLNLPNEGMKGMSYIHLLLDVHAWLLVNSPDSKRKKDIKRYFNTLKIWISIYLISLF